MTSKTDIHVACHEKLGTHAIYVATHILLGICGDIRLM